MCSSAWLWLMQLWYQTQSHEAIRNQTFSLETAQALSWKKVVCALSRPSSIAVSPRTFFQCTIIRKITFFSSSQSDCQLCSFCLLYLSESISLINYKESFTNIRLRSSSLIILFGLPEFQVSASVSRGLSASLERSRGGESRRNPWAWQKTAIFLVFWSNNTFLPFYFSPFFSHSKVCLLSVRTTVSIVTRTRVYIITISRIRDRDWKIYRFWGIFVPFSLIYSLSINRIYAIGI